MLLEWLEQAVMWTRSTVRNLRPREIQLRSALRRASYARRNGVAIAPSVWRAMGKIETLHDRVGALEKHARRLRPRPSRAGETQWHRSCGPKATFIR